MSTPRFPKSQASDHHIELQFRLPHPMARRRLTLPGREFQVAHRVTRDPQTVTGSSPQPRKTIPLAPSYTPAPPQFGHSLDRAPRQIRLEPSAPSDRQWARRPLASLSNAQRSQLWQQGDSPARSALPAPQTDSPLALLEEFAMFLPDQNDRATG